MVGGVGKAVLFSCVVEEALSEKVMPELRAKEKQQLTVKINPSQGKAQILNKKWLTSQKQRPLRQKCVSQDESGGR